MGKMCAKCESVPEPNHPGVRGTRAWRPPRVTGRERRWPTVVWPLPGASRRTGSGRGPAGGSAALRDSAPGRSPPLRPAAVADLRRSAPPWSGPARAARPDGSGRIGTDLRGSPHSGVALREKAADASEPGAPPVAGRGPPGDRAGGSFTLADNAPQRIPKDDHPHTGRGGPGQFWRACTGLFATSSGHLWCGSRLRRSRPQSNVASASDASMPTRAAASAVTRAPR